MYIINVNARNCPYNKKFVELSWSCYAAFVNTCPHRNNNSHHTLCIMMRIKHDDRNSTRSTKHTFIYKHHDTHASPFTLYEQYLTLSHTEQEKTEREEDEMLDI